MTLNICPFCGDTLTATPTSEIEWLVVCRCGAIGTVKWDFEKHAEVVVITRRWPEKRLK